MGRIWSKSSSLLIPALHSHHFCHLVCDYCTLEAPSCFRVDYVDDDNRKWSVLIMMKGNVLEHHMCVCVVKFRCFYISRNRWWLMIVKGNKVKTEEQFLISSCKNYSGLNAIKNLLWKIIQYWITHMTILKVVSIFKYRSLVNPQRIYLIYIVTLRERGCIWFPREYVTCCQKSFLIPITIYINYNIICFLCYYNNLSE